MTIRMSREDKAAHLANVFRIARADGKTGGEEAEILRDILECIGGDDADLEAARAILSGPDQGFRLSEVPSQRFANMEDMVLMSLADGHVDPEEAAPIEKISEALRYSQTDMDMIVRRAESRLQALRRKAASAASAPRPAPPPVPKPLPPPPPAPPVQAPPAPRAAAPRRKPRPAVSPAPTPVTAPAPPPPASTPPPASAAPAPAESAPAWVACRAARNASPAAAEYCFGLGGAAPNPWGCRLAHMDWRADAEWLALGAFRDDHTFVFDRAAIADLLRRRLAAVRDCPHLCAAYAEAALAAWPSRAMPSERWRYRSASPGAPGSRRVSVRRVRHGAETHTDEVVDGLVPVGVRGVEPIVRRALRRAARRDVNLRLLFEEANR